MNYASKELSAELFELMPEWVDEYWQDGVPLYTLGYLMRKLPAGTEIIKRTMNTPKDVEQDYSAFLPSALNGALSIDYAPEDAVCKLAIELAKQGVLTREGGEG